MTIGNKSKSFDGCIPIKFGNQGHFSKEGQDVGAELMMRILKKDGIYYCPFCNYKKTESILMPGINNCPVCEGVIFWKKRVFERRDRQKKEKGRLIILERD